MPNNHVDVEGAAALYSALNAIPSTTQAAAERGIGDWAVETEGRARAAGQASDRQSRMVSRSVRGSRDRGGKITAGGGSMLPTGTGTYSDVFWGAEFGGGSRPETRQFRPYRPRGYWFFPTVEAAETTSLMDAAADGLDAAADRWAD